MRYHFREYLLFPLLLLLIGVLLIRGAVFSQSVYRAMELCATVLVPTLFPFAALSSFLIRSGISERAAAPWSGPPARLLRSERSAVTGILFGILCGYPVGALSLQGLSEKGSIRHDTAVRFAGCCTNASPAFLILVAGKKLLGSPRCGRMLFAVHTLAVLPLLLAARPAGKTDAPPLTAQKSGQIILCGAESIRAAALTMVQISGYVVIASVFCCAVQLLLPGRPLLASFICGLLELTNGLFALAELPIAPELRFILFSFLLGFSGFCVHMQVISILMPDARGIRRYLGTKLLHGAIGAMLSIPWAFSLRGQTQPVFSAEAAPSLPLFLFTSLWALVSFTFFFTFMWKFPARRGIINSDRDNGGSHHAV